MDKVLVVDSGKCTGCRVCELVCSMAKQGEYNPRKSFIRLLRNREMDVNVITLVISCDFCGKCMEWCPTKALSFVTYEEAAIIRKDNKLGIDIAPVVE